MKCLIVDSAEFYHSGITDHLFGIKKDIEVNCTSSINSAIEILRCCNDKKNDIDYCWVICDVQFENGYKSFDVIEYCVQNKIKVAVFTRCENAATAKKVVDIGANGLISKLERFIDIQDCFKKLVSVENCLSPRMINILNETVINFNFKQLDLTDSERNLMYCLSFGMCMKSISIDTGLSINTLRAHRSNIIKKNNGNIEWLMACFREFPPQESFDQSFLRNRIKYI